MSRRAPTRIVSETIKDADQDYELRRHRSLVEADRELDKRTEVSWTAVADPEIRCSQRYETRGLRIMHCSETAAWLKWRKFPHKKKPDPLAYLCDQHARQRGLKEVSE
jgi:hypothetical protein